MSKPLRENVPVLVFLHASAAVALVLCALCFIWNNTVLEIAFGTFLGIFVIGSVLAVSIDQERVRKEECGPE